MRTLILTDELWSEMAETLLLSDRGRKALIQMDEGPPPLPGSRELVAMGRAKQTPAAVQRAVAYRDAGRQAADDTRLQLEELLIECWHAGVGPTVLSEWFGLPQSRVYEILAPARTQV